MRLSNFRTPQGALLNIYNKKGVISTNLFGKLQEVDPAINDDFLTILNMLKNAIVYVDPNNTNITNKQILNDVEEMLNDLLKVMGYTNQTVTRIENVQATTKTKKVSSTPQNPAPQVVAPAGVEKPQDKTPQDVLQEEKERQLMKELAINTDSMLIKFFNDFNIDIAYSSRFKNTLLHETQKSKKAGIQYVKNYIKLIDHTDQEEIFSKIKSVEFDEILNNLQKIKTSKKINNRLLIYYGPAGTGKTYKATSENPQASVMACHSNMEPQQLFSKYVFINGVPHEVKSALIQAMEQGQPVILDEINLLPYESLQALQTIADGKKIFTLFINGKNENIEIKEGFRIIGTMNLIVNGRVLALPEPIVDRAEIIEIKYNSNNILWM